MQTTIEVPVVQSRVPDVQVNQWLEVIEAMYEAVAKSGNDPIVLEGVRKTLILMIWSEAHSIGYEQGYEAAKSRPKMKRVMVQ